MYEDFFFTEYFTPLHLFSEKPFNLSVQKNNLVALKSEFIALQISSYCISFNGTWTKCDK